VLDACRFVLLKQVVTEQELETIIKPVSVAMVLAVLGTLKMAVSWLTGADAVTMCKAMHPPIAAG
jgi:hypothetical protein